MSITRLTPNTIMLACKGDPLVVNNLVASAAITPGYLVEKHSDSGVLKWRKNASATEIPEMAVMLNQSELNLGVDTACAAGDLIPVWMLGVGDVFWGLIPSGQDIAVGDLLQSNGDGLLKEATASTSDANLGKFKALNAPGVVTVATRVKVERIQ